MASITDGFVGRDLLASWGGVAVGGMREKSVKINGEAIDVTSDDDAGWRKLLTVPGQKQVDIQVSGVTKSQALKSDVFAGTTTKTLVLTYPGGSTLSATFFLQSYDEKGSYKDAVTYEASFMSSGPVSFLAA